MTFVMFSYTNAKGAKLFPSNALLLLIICLLSRVASGIYYIEDVDSLRFALSLKDYDLASFQPHFPGYFVFSMLGQFFYLLTNSIAISFSLIGGLSTFMLIVALGRIYHHFYPADRSGNTLLIALLFFNPIIWLMSNRYMADLLGLAFLGVSCLFFMLTLVEKERKWLIAYYISLGLLAGSRLSYVPFFLPLTVYLAWKFRQELHWQFLSGLIGVGVWLVPMIIDTGWNELVAVAQSGTSGHFNEWGGTIRTDSIYGLRLVRMFQYSWADGLGGFWPGRNFLTLLSSVLFILCGYFFFFSSKKDTETSSQNKRTLAYLFLSALVTYAIWAFLYQNVLYKARHLMPFIPFLLLMISRGGSQLLSQWKYIGWGVLITGMSTYIVTTGVLVWQHKRPTAIAQVKNFVASKKNTERPVYIIGDRLIEFYLNRQLTQNVNFLTLDTPSEKVENLLEQGALVYTFEPLPELTGRNHSQTYSFYHNPYVNRLWSEITLYEY